ncbi:MAG: hypothetical protein PWQ55_1191 [Chloroflexota bacterium]|nr:hypothetical protein [Chloroflexota bacterium]
MRRYSIGALAVIAGLGLLMGTVMMGFVPADENLVGNIRMQLTLGVDPESGDANIGVDLLGAQAGVDANLGDGDVNADVNLGNTNSNVNVDLGGANGVDVNADLLNSGDGTGNDGSSGGSGGGGGGNSGGGGGASDGFFGLFDTPVPDEMMEEEVQSQNGFLAGFGDFIEANWQILLILLAIVFILVFIFKR